MNFLTLADLKAADSPLRTVTGVCPEDSRFVRYCNDAVRQLMKRGDWVNTVVPIHVCIRRGCVTFPRYVGSIRKMNLCGTPVPVTNIWCNYLPRDNWPRWFSFPGLFPWNVLSKNYGLKTSSCGASKAGYYSTYADPQGDRFIRAYPQVPEDIGKTVTIFGKDEYGQPLKTKNTASDGTVTYTPGVVITIAAPYGSTSVLVQTPIHRVIKDATEGRVYLYAYNATDDVLEDLAVYEPSETNPTYERFRIPGYQSSDGSCTETLMALVKLKYIPMVNDTDLCLIPDIDALKLMIQSILFGEGNDKAMKDDFEASAIRELNLMLRDQYPEDQTPVEVDPFSATGIGPQSMF